MCTPSFVLIGCCVSELHGHICPYRNVWPEAVYCCFTRTTSFTILFIYMNNHVHSAPQEHIERERKDSEHRKNTQNIHNITTIHKPHGLEK